MPYETQDVLLQVAADVRSIQHQVSEMSAAIAVLQTHEESHKQNIARFWAETWPRIEGSLTDHESRLKAIERLEIRKIDGRFSEMDKRLDTIEQWQSKAAGALAIISLAIPIVTALLLKALGS